MPVCSPRRHGRGGEWACFSSYGASASETSQSVLIARRRSIPRKLYNREPWLRDASGYFAKTEPKATLEELLLRHPEYSFRSLSSAPSSVSTNVSGYTVKCAAGIFAFSCAKLEDAKQALSSSLPAKVLTGNNLLAAALWLSITCIRLERMRREGLAPVTGSTTSKLGFAINARSKLGSDVLNKSYWGNVTMLKVVDFPATTLESIAGNATTSLAAADLSLMAPVISAIAAATSTVTADRVSEVIGLSDLLADFEDVGAGWNSSNGLDLTYTSWAKFRNVRLRFRGRFRGEAAVCEDPIYALY